MNIALIWHDNIVKNLLKTNGVESNEMNNVNIQYIGRQFEQQQQN